MAAEPPPTGASPEAEAPVKPPRAYVFNPIAHVHTTAGWYVLNGFGTVPVLPLLVAFLLSNDVLSTHDLQGFVDGQRTLPAALVERLAWFGSKRILLDWFPLQGEMCQGTQHPGSRGQDPQRRAGSIAHLALARPRGHGHRLPA